MLCFRSIIVICEVISNACHNNPVKYWEPALHVRTDGTQKILQYRYYVPQNVFPERHVGKCVTQPREYLEFGRGSYIGGIE